MPRRTLQHFAAGTVMKKTAEEQALVFAQVPRNESVFTAKGKDDGCEQEMILLKRWLISKGSGPPCRKERDKGRATVAST